MLERWLDRAPECPDYPGLVFSYLRRQKQSAVDQKGCIPDQKRDISDQK
jgi:hypothetical protein